MAPKPPRTESHPCLCSCQAGRYVVLQRRTSSSTPKGSSPRVQTRAAPSSFPPCLSLLYCPYCASTRPRTVDPARPVIAVVDALVAPRPPAERPDFFLVVITLAGLARAARSAPSPLPLPIHARLHPALRLALLAGSVLLPSALVRPLPLAAATAIAAVALSGVPRPEPLPTALQEAATCSRLAPSRAPLTTLAAVPILLAGHREGCSPRWSSLGDELLLGSEAPFLDQPRAAVRYGGTRGAIPRRRPTLLDRSRAGTVRSSGLTLRSHWSGRKDGKELGRTSNFLTYPSRRRTRALTPHTRNPRTEGALWSRKPGTEE